MALLLSSVLLAGACGEGGDDTAPAPTTGAPVTSVDSVVATTTAPPTTTPSPTTEVPATTEAPASDVCTEGWKRDLFPDGHGGSRNPPAGVTFVTMPGFDRIQFATTGFQIHMVSELGSDPVDLYGVEVGGTSVYLVALGGWTGTYTGPERIPATDTGAVVEVVHIEAASPEELAYLVGMDNPSMVRVARGDAPTTLWLDVCN